MGAALFRPLTPQWRMQKHWTDGSRMHDVAAEFIKPNDRLSFFERLEIYNRQYWFRVKRVFEKLTLPLAKRGSSARWP
jgi:hypothetical protein